MSTQFCGTGESSKAEKITSLTEFLKNKIDLE